MESVSTRSGGWYEELAAVLAGGDGLILGARGSSLTRCLAGMRGMFQHPLLLIAPEPEIAGDLYNDLLFYLGDSEAVPLYWPAWDILPFETDSPDGETAADQVAVLRACLERPDNLWIVAPATALLQPTLARDIIRTGGLTVASGDETSPDALIARLVEGGLEPVAQVDAPGQFSRRGGIIDVFPMLGDAPFRIEFFGDAVETVRVFDPATQASEPLLAGKVVLVDVSRDSFRKMRNSSGCLAHHLPSGTTVVLWHPERIARVAGLYAEGFSDSSALLDFTEVAGKLSRHPLAIVPDLDSDPWPGVPWRRADAPATVDLGASGWERLSGGFETSLSELAGLAGKNTRTTIVCDSEGGEKRLRQLLEERVPGLAGGLEIRQGRLSRGFIRETPRGGEAFVSDHELFGRAVPVRAVRKRRFAGSPIADFAELREGDHVVHVANGIARYEGMRAIEVKGARQDFLVLRFADDARIYVPLSHIDLVRRYIGLGEGVPQLSKLGSAAWSRRKEIVERAVRDIAQELLATHARRLAAPGFSLPPDDQMVR
ncbi:MAG: hypothetical protein LBE84_09455, partial [Planctomycetota bacterium]|nr:hypothetical protein [Planctomycetota bacterium]